LRPLRRLGGGEGFGRLTGAARFIRVDPRREVARRQLWKGEKEIAEIAFGIDGNDGHAVDCRLFDQVDSQAGLAAAGHARDDGMGDELGGVVKDEVAARLTEVEESELFVVGGGRRRRGGHCRTLPSSRYRKIVRERPSASLKVSDFSGVQSP